jgi:hypothetical protein
VRGWGGVVTLSLLFSDGCTVSDSPTKERTWVVLVRSKYPDRPPVLYEAHASQERAVRRAETLVAQPYNLDAFVAEDSPSLWVNADGGIAATSRANLRARLNRIQAGGTIPSNETIGRRRAVVGLIEEAEPAPGLATTSVAPFVVPQEFERRDAPKCAACEGECTLVLEVRCGAGDDPKYLGIWSCLSGDCRQWRVPVVLSEGTLRTTKARFAVPGASWDDYPLPDRFRGYFDEGVNATRHLIADHWKVGGHPCWIDRQRVRCQCGSEPELACQITSAEELGVVLAGDSAFAYIFICKDCGTPVVVLQSL